MSSDSLCRRKADPGRMSSEVRGRLPDLGPAKDVEKSEACDSAIDGLGAIGESTDGRVASDASYESVLWVISAELGDAKTGSGFRVEDAWLPIVAVLRS